MIVIATFASPMKLLFPFKKAGFEDLFKAQHKCWKTTLLSDMFETILTKL